MKLFSRLGLIAALSLVAVATAADVKFDSPDALKQLDLKNKPDSVLVNEVAGEKALTFSAPRQVSVVGFLTDGGKNVVSAAGPVATEFKFLAPATSIGLIVRATPDSKDSYTVLVNSYPKNGGTIRVFRTSAWPQKNLQNVQPLVNKYCSLPLDKWLKLTVTVANTDAGAVEVTAAVSDADSGKAIAKAVAADSESPLKDPGSVALRLYGSEDYAQIRVRSLSASADSK